MGALVWGGRVTGVISEDPCLRLWEALINWLGILACCGYADLVRAQILSTANYATLPTLWTLFIGAS
jgi:hypothetical protein